MEEQTDSNRPPTLFISHRHQDRLLADTFRIAFEEWSNGNVTIFQSSNRDAGIKVGDTLENSIRKAAGDASVLLLIYTVTDDDWTWCMYECGLAQDPKTLKTRVLVFHTTESAPSPLSHLLTLPMNRDSIEILVNQFHKEVDFFPNLGHAIAPDISQKIIDRRIDKLYDDLRERIIDDVVETTIRYDQISVSLSMEEVEKIKSERQATNFNGAIKYALQFLPDKCIIYDYSGDPHTHFNLDKLDIDVDKPDKHKTIMDLAEEWRKETDYPELEWDKEIYREIVGAVLNRKEGALSIPFNSLDPDSSSWFLPMLHTVRLNPQDQVLEMDISFCKLKEVTAKALIKELQA